MVLVGVSRTSKTPTSIYLANRGIKTANIPIVPRLTASLVSGCATECTVELGCVSVCGAFGQVSGGAAPLTYTRTSGQLPAGTTLNGLTLNGTFIGLPGRLQFTVQVTDGFGVIATIAPRYNLLPHISFGGGALSCPYNGCGAPSTLPYQGGSGTPGVARASRPARLTRLNGTGRQVHPPSVISFSGCQRRSSGDRGG